MARHRKRIGKGIYRDPYGLSATVKVGTGSDALQREKRFPFDTPQMVIKTWQEAMRTELRRALHRPAAVRGTLAEDARRYLGQVKHLASYKSRVCEVDAWTALYGRVRRSQLTAEHVRKARAAWVADGYTPKTVNNRVQTLQHLFHMLDGEKAPTPADEIKKLLDASDYAKALYRAGWPKDVRPYQARHSMALELGERGIDLADVAAMLGHKDMATTRRHYQGILASRLKGGSDTLAGRFSGWQVPEPDEDSGGSGLESGKTDIVSLATDSAAVH
jgi:hypothetical protein